MSCRVCTPCSPTDQSCITSPVVLAPCTCTETPATRAEGPPGTEGAVGDTPAFTVGTVTEGAANVVLTQNTPTDYTVDFVVPQPPIDVANEWTAVQTYDMQAVFVEGLTTNNGTSTFGGTAFTVTPNASFGNNLTIGGNESLAGNLTVGGNETVTGTLGITGASTLADVEIDGQLSFGTSATIVLPVITGFVKGTVVVDSCGKPKLVSGLGGDFYQQGNAGLLTVLAGTDGPICTTFSIVVPASTCPPSLTPTVDIEVRVSYNFPGSIITNCTFKLWKGAIDSGVLLDSVLMGGGTTGNSSDQTFLKARTTLVTGTTYFNVEMENPSAQNCSCIQATLWASN